MWLLLYAAKGRLRTRALPGLAHANPSPGRHPFRGPRHRRGRARARRHRHHVQPGHHQPRAVPRRGDGDRRPDRGPVAPRTAGSSTRSSTSPATTRRRPGCPPRRSRAGSGGTCSSPPCRCTPARRRPRRSSRTRRSPSSSRTSTDPLENYGANKALCEAVIREVYGERALIGRPGADQRPARPDRPVPLLAAADRARRPGARARRRRRPDPGDRRAGPGGVPARRHPPRQGRRVQPDGSPAPVRDPP